MSYEIILQFLLFLKMSLINRQVVGIKISPLNRKQMRLLNCVFLRGALSVPEGNFEVF